MPLIKNAVSSLTQGVSQQAESQRFPSQATEQINAYSSPIKGLVKRPPTKFVNRVEADTTGKAFVHTINRDSSEQYTVVVNPYTAVTVANFNVGTDTVEITSELAVNTAIRFTMTTESGRFPKGIEANTTYYVKTSAASGSNFNITLSKTKGGALVRIGKVQVDGIKIVSVREKATKQWVDGVYEITFAANHGFSAGDVITIDNLAGKAITMLGETTEYELRVPDNYDYHYTYSNSEGYEVKAWNANKFLLGIPNKGRTLDQNLGYATDTETLAGWNQIGNNDLHWTALDATTSANTSHNKCATLRYNSDDSLPVGWTTANLVGALIRLGNRRNKSKTHRAIVTGHDASARTITLESIVDLEDEFFDSNIYDPNTGAVITTYNTSSNPKWVFVAIWGDTSTSIYNEGSNPRQFKESGTPKETADATVGSDTAVGTFRGETGGISIYDNTTGAQQTLNIDSGLEYLTEGNDPNKNLKAVTVADYTFLVNKSVPTNAKSDTKYDKRYEAIITAKTADYGKRYKVKIGEAASPIEVVADGGSNTVAYVDIKGRNKELENEKWIARIQSKTADPKFNGYEIRVVQSWDWNHYKTNVNKYKLPHRATEAERNSYGYEDFLPRQSLLVLNIPVKGYYYYNERAAVYVKDREITIYGNFHWANSTEVTSRLTTVQDLIDLFANTPALAAEWEVKTLTGTASSTTPTVAGDNTAAAGYTFDKCIVGKQGREYNHDGHQFFFGRNESIQADWSGAAGGVTFSTQYRSAGYLSPSAVPDEKFERKYFTSHAGRTQAGASWDSTDTLSPAIHQVETGEYWYKTPKWTGDVTQVATGTEKIAEMLASSARIVGGKWENTTPVKANGRSITEKPAGATETSNFTSTVAAKGAEECLGLTYQGTTNDKGYLYDINAAGDNKILGGHEGNWQVQQQGYTIALLAPDRAQFQISVEDDFGGRGLSLTYFEVGESADLPAVARHGHIVKVIGDAREEADDYYLRFIGDDPNEFSTLQHGRWQECVGYEQRYLLDSATMPVGLVRESDGTFTLKQLEWDERKAGDDISNPFPSFVGNTISDIFLFRNRLGFLSGENIIFSEAGEYFNFFRTTVAALVDSAPIDIAASTNKVSTLHSAVPYNERLILFSDQTQFTLDADPFLSVRHVTLTPSNEIDNIPDATPVVSGDAIFYGFSRTGYSGVGQLNVSSSDADLIESGDATGHIPKYIKGNITKLAAATNEDVICCITDDTTSASLYVHKYMVNEQNQKIQAAWFKYQFGTTNDFIADISFLGNTLYMVVKRGSEMFLESLVFEDELKTAGMDYEVLLDQRIDNLGISVSGSTTTVTLPTDTAYTMTSAHRVVTEDSAILTPSNITATTFDLPVNLTGKKFFIGIPYTMEYTFSQPFLKSQKVTETGRYQLHRGILQYANSRSFTLDVIHNAHIATEFQTTNTNTFTTDSVQNLLEGTAELQEGKFLFPIRERNDRLGMVLKNTSPYPADFLSIDYEARVFSRGSRWSS